MNENTLKPDNIILGEVNYSAALNLVIAEAKEQLLIFDQDFSCGNYTSITRFNLIQGFLSQSPSSELTIILQNTDFFTQQCPRLFNLLSSYNHKMTVYETNNHAKIAKDCFVLVDHKSYLRRFHIHQARFKFMLNDIDTTASLTDRFDELREETTHAVSASKLGL
jgi:hypothetical protein